MQMRTITSIIFILAIAVSINSIFFDRNSYSNIPFGDSEEYADFYIKGLGDFSREDIYFIKERLESMGFKAEVSTFCPAVSGDIDCADIQNRIVGHAMFDYDPSRPMTIYVTDQQIYSLGQKVRGVCFGSQIYIRTKGNDNSGKISRKDAISGTLIHEISHSFGLHHCKNRCLMNIGRRRKFDKEMIDASGKGIFCESCRSKIPDFLK